MTEPSNIKVRCGRCRRILDVVRQLTEPLTIPLLTPADEAAARQAGRRVPGLPRPAIGKVIDAGRPRYRCRCGAPPIAIDERLTRAVEQARVDERREVLAFVDF